MFNLLPDEMCQTCFHVHTTPDWCSADDWAPNPDGGDDWLGPCSCQINADREYVSHLYLVDCARPEHADQPPHGHTEYRE